jgi:hypothetical protein
MTKPATLQHILDRFLDTEHLDSHRRRICGHLQACRTAAMGGVHLQCERCDTEQYAYFGCRDRHCPQCQGRATREWAARQRGHILPVSYFHLVFTLPHTLNGWVQLHPEVIYAVLFHSAWETLKAFGQNAKALQGEMGMSAVLHTWGQNLSQHVHLHCLVPGGALGADGTWRERNGHYLFPVKALSRRFRGRIVGELRKAANHGELYRVMHEGEVDAVLNALMAEEWVVYMKHCLHRTESVVDYLARYTHRIAITNARILSVDEAQVTFRYKDYRDGGSHKLLRLSGDEFVRRFLLHIVPKGLMRVRHFGFLANRCRAKKLALIRRTLTAGGTEPTRVTESSGDPVYLCPRCHQALRVIAFVPPRAAVLEQHHRAQKGRCYLQ